MGNLLCFQQGSRNESTRTSAASADQLGRASVTGWTSIRHVPASAPASSAPTTCGDAPQALLSQGHQSNNASSLARQWCAYVWRARGCLCECRMRNAGAGWVAECLREHVHAGCWAHRSAGVQARLRADVRVCRCAGVLRYWADKRVVARTIHPSTGETFWVDRRWALGLEKNTGWALPVLAQYTANYTARNAGARCLD